MKNERDPNVRKMQSHLLRYYRDTGSIAYLLFRYSNFYLICYSFNTPAESVSLCSKEDALYRERWCLRRASQHAGTLKNEASSKKDVLHSPAIRILRRCPGFYSCEYTCILDHVLQNQLFSDITITSDY